MERLWAEDGTMGLDPLRLDDGNVYFSPVVEAVSSFKPSRYKSPLMPEENKPLEVGILRRVKELLAEIDPRTAAKHITKADCMVLFEATNQYQLFTLVYFSFRGRLSSVNMVISLKFVNTGLGGLQDELIQFCWSKVEVAVTSENTFLSWLFVF